MCVLRQCPNTPEMILAQFVTCVFWNIMRFFSSPVWFLLQPASVCAVPALEYRAGRWEETVGGMDSEDWMMTSPHRIGFCGCGLGQGNRIQKWRHVSVWLMSYLNAALITLIETKISSSSCRLDCCETVLGWSTKKLWMHATSVTKHVM